MDLYKIKLQIDDIKMQQELKKSMAFLTYPKNYSVESNCLYISEKQFIWDGDLYQVNSDKTVENFQMMFRLNLILILFVENMKSY